MENKAPTNIIEVDVIHIIKTLWHRAWIIVLCMFLCGASAFAYAKLFVTPTYNSTAMMYVNNTSVSGEDTRTISTSELSAAKSLLDIYIVILKSQTTLKTVIEQADLDYSTKELSRMISAVSVDGTEVFSITATSTDPVEAELIADTIVEVLPERISGIVKGSSVCVVDYAELPVQRSAPSYSKYAVIGILLGMLLSCGAIVILDLMDTTIRDEDYLQQMYSIPVLAAVPDAYGARKSSYSQYYRGETTAAKKE